MIERLKEGWSVGMVGAAFHQSDTTVRKWWRRYRAEGSAGLQDRSSRPNRFRRPVSQGRVVQIIALRRKRLTGWQIAQILRMPRSTVLRDVTMERDILEKALGNFADEQKRSFALITSARMQRYVKVRRDTEKARGPRSRKSNTRGTISFLNTCLIKVDVRPGERRC
jgi:transposase-like protein